MTPLDACMREEDFNDKQRAALVGRGRSTITKLRRGQARPSWELANEIAKISKGKVPPDAYPFVDAEPPAASEAGAA